MLVNFKLHQKAQKDYTVSSKTYRRLVQIIQQSLNPQISPDTIVIIDSFPLPLCQHVRKYRTLIFKGLADIGYNASKQLWL